MSYDNSRLDCRCKIFTSNDQEAINKWLQTSRIIIHFVTQTETDNDFTLTIFYSPA